MGGHQGRFVTDLAPRTVPQAAVRLARLGGWIRVVAGTAFVLAPRRAARPWVGSGGDTHGAQLLARSMGIRDLLLGVGLLQSLNHGDLSGASTWLGFGAAAGVVDTGATMAACAGLPRSGRVFLIFIVGALITDASLALQLRQEPCDGK